MATGDSHVSTRGNDAKSVVGSAGIAVLGRDDLARVRVSIVEAEFSTLVEPEGTAG